MRATSELGKVRAYFHNFGAHQAPQTGSPLYTDICLRAAEDAEMIEFAASCPPTQPSANLLLASVHALLLKGDPHPLRRFYPDVMASEADAEPPDATTYPLFREFVFEHRDEILPMLETRRVQTNVVRRTTVMLPLFALAARESGGRPLALIELGASGGLNLHWDRYHHTYRFESEADRVWGDTDSPLHLSARVQSDALPDLQDDLRVASRVGIDLDPVDVGDPEQLLWLRALVFPEHVERHGELEAASGIARAHPARILRGDASELAAALVEQAPDDATPCLYATAVLNQFPQESRQRLFDALSATARQRPFWLLTLDGTPNGNALLRVGRFTSSGRRTREVARAHAHGRWIHWASD